MNKNLVPEIPINDTVQKKASKESNNNNFKKNICEKLFFFHFKFYSEKKKLQKLKLSF